MKGARFSKVFFAAASLTILAVSPVFASRKNAAVSPDDLTYQLYQKLDNSYGGKLNDLYVLADVYADPQNPGNELQHVLRLEYDKSRYFGRFRILVRTVAKLTPEQLKSYTPEQIYQFGEQDDEKFEKIDPGPFGQTGDLFLHTNSSGMLATAPITDDVRKQYESFIMQYILPALKK